MNWIEFIGYAGSVLVAVSLTMKSMVKLRWINLGGAATFAVYGLLINAYPVLVLNSFIALTNIFYIVQMYLKKDFIEVFEADSLDTAFARRFLEFYQSDLEYFFPDFNTEALKSPLIYFMVRNMVPVGLFVGQPNDNNVLDVKMEYAIPDYRDLKNARHLYGNRERYFIDKGISELQVQTRVAEHARFIKKVGFEATGEPGNYRLVL